MSLILDALKRAERDRRAEPVPGVEVPTLARPVRRRLWLRIVLGLVFAIVAVLALAVAVRVIKNRRAATPPAIPARTLAPKPQPPVAQVVTPPVAAPVQAPPQTGNLVARAPPRPAPKPIPGTESVSSLDELSEPEPPPPSVSVSPPQQRAASAPAPSPAPAAASDDKTPDEAPSPSPAARDDSAPEKEIPQALTQQAPLRKLREMPPEFRADFPPLNVQVHNFERDPAARFVIVNDRRYKEGETLAEGPRIAEISKDGMILEFRGEKLLYTLNR